MLLSSPDPFPSVTRRSRWTPRSPCRIRSPTGFSRRCFTTTKEAGYPWDGDGAVEVVRNYAQRIWDITASCWVYYTQTAINPTPLTADTVPTHSGSLRAASHEVLFVVEQD